MIINIINDFEPTDLNIWNNVLQVFEKNKNIIFFIDTTLYESFWDDFIQNLKDKEIFYIPIAKRSNKSPLFLLRLRKKDQLEEVKEDIIYFLKKNLDYNNDLYVICGFGTSSFEDLDSLGEKLKKTLVLNDFGKNVFFRWFDPRVLIYLNHIFNDERLKSFMQYFEEWYFFHVSGLYAYEKRMITDLKTKRMIINKKESLQLDFIEISNLAYQQAFKLENVDHILISPSKILDAVRDGYYHYKIINNIDLLSYVLYTQVMHPDFMKHFLVKEVLEKNWNDREEPESFMNAMNLLAESNWQIIKNDLLVEER